MQIGASITECILSSFDTEYLNSVFGGVIEIDDLVDQSFLNPTQHFFIETFITHKGHPKLLMAFLPTSTRL